MKFTFNLNKKEFSMKKAKMLSLTASLVLAITFTLSCSSDDGDEGGGGGSCTNFKTVEIESSGFGRGSLTWMAENLNCNVEGSRCYKDDPENCKKYGRLYDWNTALTACPSGWHLPTTSEWAGLIDRASIIVGGKKEPGKKLKAKSGWSSSSNGTDEYGFSALPGGRGTSGGYFENIGDAGYWWKNSPEGKYAYYVGLGYSNDVGENGVEKTYLLSVRCVKDH